MRRALMSALAVSTAWPLRGLAAEPRAPRAVTREDLEAAMSESRGYVATATTNGARFQAEVLLRLARQAAARDAEQATILVSHADWYHALLQRSGLSPDEAPAFVRLGYEYRQDIAVDYGNDRVIRRVREGAPPVFALSVRIGWPLGPGARKSYSYEDALSNPRLKVTNRNLITYRLLDFGDMVVYDEIEGLSGRPTSGILGLLFSIIGEGHVVQSRMAISADGLQVSRARAEKGFMRVVTTVTVHPDGRTEKEIPPSRSDLRALDERLRQPLRIDYMPMPAPAFD
jgi:hypothetical protein